MRRFTPGLAGFLAVLMPYTMLAAELPIRSVVLYKNGLGYFERSGQLAAGDSARLDFKATDMNDVLKSLTIADRGGVKITGIHYDSSEPLENKLAEFPFELKDGATLAEFLDRLKGARIEMKFGADVVAGNIVSARVTPADKDHAGRQQVVLLLDSGELRTLDLDAASSLRFTDVKLQSLLRDYLTAMSQARSKDKRSVYIDGGNGKARDIVAAYTLPSAVWKSSYRLVFGDAPQPTLQGWAIVDNTSGEDWNNVQVSVVSGRPVSFISQLYDAKFVARQTVELPEDAVAAPVIYEGGVATAVTVESQRSPVPTAKAMLPLNGAGTGGGMGGGSFSVSGGRLAADMASSLRIATEGHEAGDLFEYRFSSPVTVKRDQSIMLPFVQQPLTARKLLIYSESYGLNPMSAAELTNSTGQTLDGGPMTVFEGANYAGESLMETVKAGDKRLISYAVDLGTRVTTAINSGSTVVREIHVNRGTLTSRAAAEETKTFTIRNVDPKPKTLIVEYPHRTQYKLLNQKPMETTSKAYRFEVKLAANASQVFPVEEERVFDEIYALTNLTPDVLATYVENKAISDAGKKQLEGILDQKRKIAQLDADLRQMESDTNDMVRDQERIRQNINSLRQVSGQQDQVQKYARQLTDQEQELANKRDQMAQMKKQRATLTAQLNMSIEKLSF